MNAALAYSILIVDDEVTNCKLLQLMLQPEGYRTSYATSGAAALVAITACPPDLILLDIMMPGLGGYDVANLLKGNPLTSNIPIIMVTAHTSQGARIAGLSTGAEDFLSKPVDRTELWLRVRNLLRLKSFGDLQLHSTMLEQQVQARTAELQRFRTAMDVTADAILLVDRISMLFIECNVTACALLGYTRAEMFRIGPADLGVGTRLRLEAEFDKLITGQPDPTLYETRLRRKDGVMVLVEMHRQALSSGGRWIVVGVVRDITERKNAERRLQYQAHHDALTGLPNRSQFFATLQHTLRMAKDGALLAVLFIDLDHFKNVNDTMGHAVGDAVLTQFSNRLLECVRIRDTVGRLGGDEFAVIAIMQDGRHGAGIIATKIRDALRAPFLVMGHEIGMTASIGVTIYPDDADDANTLIKYADTAMYRAKQAGRDTYRYFTAQMNVDVLSRLALEVALRKAIERQEFVLFYQPKVRLSTGRISGIEALLRWNRPGHGVLAPDQFMAVLEETGMIEAVGSWVIDQACRQIGDWLRGGVGAVQIAVNVSARQFAEGDLDGDVARGLATHRIPAELLELELTETSLMSNIGLASAILDQLQRRGVHIAIDDFGTGYSSLAYLRRFPITKLKIDITFIRDITTNPDDAAIVRAVIRMAHGLKLQVIAEGVETEAQLNALRRIQCDQIQGYYFSRPLPVDQITSLLLEDRRLPCPDLGAALRRTLLIVNDDAGAADLLAELLATDDYHILIAPTALVAFDLLARHRIQVMLYELALPVAGTDHFLYHVKELYPDTVRIVLSAQADLPSVIKHINGGAISRFYAKPLNDAQLRNHIDDAFQRIEPVQHG